MPYKQFTVFLSDTETHFPSTKKRLDVRSALFEVKITGYSCDRVLARRKCSRFNCFAFESQSRCPGDCNNRFLSRFDRCAVQEAQKFVSPRRKIISISFLAFSSLGNFLRRQEYRWRKLYGFNTRAHRRINDFVSPRPFC